MFQVLQDLPWFVVGNGSEKASWFPLWNDKAPIQFSISMGINPAMKKLLLKCVCRWKCHVEKQKTKRRVLLVVKKWKLRVQHRKRLAKLRFAFTAWQSVANARVLFQRRCSCRGMAASFAVWKQHLLIRQSVQKRVVCQWKAFVINAKADRLCQKWVRKRAKKNKVWEISEPNFRLRGKHAKRYTKKQQKILIRGVTEEILENIQTSALIFRAWKVITSAAKKRNQFLTKQSFLRWVNQVRPMLTYVRYKVPEEEVIPIAKLFMFCVHLSFVVQQHLTLPHPINLLLKEVAHRITNTFCFVPNTIVRSFNQRHKAALPLVCSAKVSQIRGLFEKHLATAGRKIQSHIPRDKKTAVNDHNIMKQILILNQLAFASDKIQMLLRFFFIECSVAEHQVRSTLFVKAVNLVFNNFNATAAQHAKGFERNGAFDVIAQQTPSLSELTAHLWKPLGL